MRFDRGRADHQPLGDLRVAQALGDQCEHLSFARSEIVGQLRSNRRARLADAPGVLGQRGHHVGLHGGVERRVAGGDGEDRGVDVLARGVRGEIPARARAQGSEDALVVGVGGERDHAHVRVAFAQPAGHLDSIHPRRPQVHQHDVRVMRGGERQRLLAIGSSGQELDAVE